MNRKLPHLVAVLVEREKVLGYLLDSQHHYGASKAQFFASHGFVPECWDLLAEALRKHGQSQKVSKKMKSAFGLRYQVDGELPAPDGRAPRVRTVWQWDKGQLALRLITAYPLKL